MVKSLFLTTSLIYLPGTHEPAAADGSMVRIAVGLVLGPCCHGPKMIRGNIFRTLDQLEASTLRFVERFYMVLFCFIKGLPLHGTATKMISTRIHTRDNVPCCEVTPNSSSHWRILHKKFQEISRRQYESPHWKPESLRRFAMDCKKTHKGCVLDFDCVPPPEI